MQGLCQTGDIASRQRTLSRSVLAAGVGSGSQFARSKFGPTRASIASAALVRPQPTCRPCNQKRHKLSSGPRAKFDRKRPQARVRAVGTPFASECESQLQLRKCISTHASA